MSQSTKRERPKKPHKDFPLTPHPTGRWCKKVRGKLEFFGKWDDPQAALEKWLAQKDDLLAGRKPRPATGGGTELGHVINLFLNYKRHLVETGELSHATWRDYKRVGERLVRTFGRTRLLEDLRPDDFERLRVSIAKKSSGGTGFGPVAISKFITST